MFARSSSAAFCMLTSPEHTAAPSSEHWYTARWGIGAATDGKVRAHRRAGLMHANERGSADAAQTSLWRCGAASAGECTGYEGKHIPTLGRSVSGRVHSL